MEDHRASTYRLSRGAESGIQLSATREWEPGSYDSGEWNSAGTQNEPQRTPSSRKARGLAGPGAVNSALSCPASCPTATVR